MSGGQSLVDRDALAVIESLGARYGLGAGALAQLRTLLQCVAGDPRAPTTITDPGAIARDHLADSLVSLELAPVRAAGTIADLGAGAGFPGLPLAVALPEASVNLVESNRRKCAFAAQSASAAGIDNAHVVPARAEEWSAGLWTCDVVVARALAPLAVVTEYAAPLLRVGGSMIVWRGRRDPEEEAAGARAAAALGLEPAPPVAVEPFPGARHRHLHVMTKVAQTPGRFPRRPGVARKRPLG